MSDWIHLCFFFKKEILSNFLDLSNEDPTEMEIMSHEKSSDLELSTKIYVSYRIVLHRKYNNSISFKKLSRKYFLLKRTTVQELIIDTKFHRRSLLLPTSDTKLWQMKKRSRYRTSGF